MAKVALRFGCAKQSNNLKRYLLSNPPLLPIFKVADIILAAVMHCTLLDKMSRRPVSETSLLEDKVL